MKVLEAILKVVRKEEVEAITDANNIIADTFSLSFSPHRENSNALFASEKL